MRKTRIYIIDPVRWSLKVLLVVFVITFWLPTSIKAVDAPSGPGSASVWAPAAKEFLGTSMSDVSRVYFTGAEGIVTEVFYPTLDKVQNVDLQLLVMDAAGNWSADQAEERKQTKHTVSLINKHALAWKVETIANNGKWKITKKIFTDPDRNSLIQRVKFETLEPGKTVQDYHVYVLNNPAIENSGGGENSSGAADNSQTLTFGEGPLSERTMLVASEPHKTSSALAVSLPWKTVDGKLKVSNGFVGRNDGWLDLFGGADDRTMDWHFDTCFGGNVAQMGWIDFGTSTQRSISFDIILSFGKDENAAMTAADATLDSNLNNVESKYIAEWVNYANGLDNQNGLADNQYYLAAMSLKAIQDKSNGAMIAGAGTPWGESNGDSNQGGYHLVWARDLFKFASALLAAGDKDSAKKAVDYLFNIQMQDDGRFPQNSYVDGTQYWSATQMDEAAMPIILAWKLHQVQPLDLNTLWPRIKKAAEFLAKNGPYTGQDRWEEMGGYSPSTIAAEIAGLVCAADLANDAGDSGAAAFYLKKADQWRNNVANWTFTTNGLHGNKQYYIRITDNDDPNDGKRLTFGNGGGTHGEQYIVDGGFLELVRMGVMSPRDWTILETLPEYDSILKQTIPGKGDAWFRYNYDGYGERNDGGSYDTQNGRGRLWPIFTAERGIYEIEKSGNATAGQPYLSALKAFSSPVGFIPEQVWNKSANITGWQTTTPTQYQPGTATRSIQPLSWAMGEYINLVAAMNHGHGDAPAIVTQRYSSDKPQTTVTFKVNAKTEWGENVYLVGDSPLLSEWIPESGIKLSSKDYPIWSVKVSLPASTTFKYKYVKRKDTDSQPIWESNNNRVFTTPESGNVSHNDTFQ